MMATLKALGNWLLGCREVDSTFTVRCQRGYEHDEPGYHRSESGWRTVQWRTDGYRRAPPAPPPSRSPAVGEFLSEGKVPPFPPRTDGRQL